MDTVLYAAFAVAYLALLVWGITLARRTGLVQPANVLLLVIVALIYDNVILAAGSAIGEGPLLEALNGARFWLHAFLTPLLVIFAINAVVRTGLAVAHERWVPVLALVLYVGLVLLDLMTEIRGLTLAPSREYGVLSYGSADPATGPPAMILGVTLVLLIASIIVWWKQGWPWFFAGVLLMGIGSSVTPPVESAAVTNAFELILITSLMLTKRQQDETDEGVRTPPATIRGRDVSAGRQPLSAPPSTTR